MKRPLEGMENYSSTAFQESLAPESKHIKLTENFYCTAVPPKQLCCMGTGLPVVSVADYFGPVGLLVEPGSASGSSCECMN